MQDEAGFVNNIKLQRKKKGLRKTVYNSLFKKPKNLKYYKLERPKNRKKSPFTVCTYCDLANRTVLQQMPNKPIYVGSKEKWLINQKCYHPNTYPRLYLSSLCSFLLGSIVFRKPSRTFDKASVIPIIGFRTATGTARTTARTVPEGPSLS